MRLRKIKNAMIKLQKHKNVVVFEAEKYYQKWSLLFKNANPIYVEIGMGKGKFILEHAQQNPGVNYVGIEISESITLKAARKIKGQNIENLRIINIEAIKLPDIFSVGEVAKIFLNFSDPWPKARHEKRRLTSEAYLNLYKNLLCDEGTIELKTDNRQFFQYNLIQFNNYGFIFQDVNLDLHEQKESSIVCTEYEDKFIAAGKKIYFIKVKK